MLALSNATYSELVAVKDSDVTHLPDGLEITDAAALPLIFLTGDQVVRIATNVQKGQAVLITGAHAEAELRISHELRTKIWN